MSPPLSERLKDWHHFLTSASSLFETQMSAHYAEAFLNWQPLL